MRATEVLLFEKPIEYNVTYHIRLSHNAPSIDSSSTIYIAENLSSLLINRTLSIMCLVDFSSSSYSFSNEFSSDFNDLLLQNASNSFPLFFTLQLCTPSSICTLAFFPYPYNDYK